MIPTRPPQDIYQAIASGKYIAARVTMENDRCVESTTWMAWASKDRVTMTRILEWLGGDVNGQIQFIRSTGCTISAIELEWWEVKLPTTLHGDHSQFRYAFGRNQVMVAPPYWRDLIGTPKKRTGQWLKEEKAQVRFLGKNLPHRIEGKSLIYQEMNYATA